MTQPEINKYITEKMLGKCWHELTGTFERPNCSCGGWFSNEHYKLNPDYSQWEHYGPMIRECMKKGWWEDFLGYLFEYRIIYESCYIKDSVWGYSDINSVDTLLNPALGSKAIAEFMRGRE